MNRKVLLIGLLLVAPLLVMLGSGLRHDPREVVSPLIGQPAPDFTLADLDGRPLALAELRGQPVVVNFWATWISAGGRRAAPSSSSATGAGSR